MILVCGEALMDVFASANTPTGLALDARIGGSPLNVAIGLARLGQNCAFFGGVSTDFLGDRLVQAMRDEGVNTESLVRLDAPTTLVMVGVAGLGKPVYQFLGAGAADRQLQAEHHAQVPAALRAIHLGSYCTVIDPVASTLEKLVIEYSRRCVIAFDPNVRVGVEADLAKWRARFEFMMHHASVIKLSDEDLELLYPGVATQHLAERCLSAQVALVIVTRGAEGASGWTRQGRIDVTSPKIELLDTVGAGDTVQAAVLTWLDEQRLLSITGIETLATAQTTELLKFAVSAAAITCSRRGADLPRRGELKPRTQSQVNL
jgi:fructokinase